MVSEIIILDVHEKLKNLQKREEFRSLMAGVNKCEGKLRDFLPCLKTHKGTGVDSKKDSLDLLYSLENDIDGILVQLALSKASAVQSFKSLFKKEDLSKKMNKIAFCLKLLEPELKKVSENSEIEQTEESRKAEVGRRRRNARDIVGMEDKVRELELKTLNRCENYFPIAIVGRAGSGKTFLVRQILDRYKERNKFDTFAFVSISQNFKENDVLVEILEQVAGVRDQTKTSTDELKKKLSFLLERKSYLIVLDDVHEANVWYKLQPAFRNPSKASRVILTIRDVSVARSISPTVVLVHLRPLTPDKSWELFSRTLENDDHAAPEVPKVLKKKILHTCEGLPLQILVLGGILSSKHQGEKLTSTQEEEWSKVLDRIGDGIHQPSSSNQQSSNAAQSSTIFDIGFQELDSSLKAFFCYLCLFPKSSKVRTRRLYRLWVAEGASTSAGKPASEGASTSAGKPASEGASTSAAKPAPQGVSQSTEAVVDDYLRKLESLNLIEVTELTSDGKTKTFQVPTALYDKFISNAEKLRYHHIADLPEAGEPDPIRKLSVFSNIQSPSCKFDEVRSYICFDKQKGDKPAEEVGNFIQNIVDKKGFGLMTVLDLEGVYKPLLPKKLGQILPLLKFIGLRGTFLDSIPDSIGDLSFLETLDVKRTNITRLPLSVWNVKELQHLYLNENPIEYSNSKSCSSPTKLQILCGLLIGKQNSPVDHGNNFSPMEWLKGLKALRKLGLTCHTESVGNIIDSFEENLQVLKLRAINDFFEPSEIKKLESLNKLNQLKKLYLLGKLPNGISTFPLLLTIERLTLSVSHLSDDPMEVLSQLKNLKVLKLLARSYMGKTLTCPSRGFDNLQVLNLWMLTELKQWSIKEGAMPELKRLEIRLCRKLSEANGLEHLKSLEKVTLTNMGDDFVKEVKNKLSGQENIKIDHPNYSFNPSWDDSKGDGSKESGSVAFLKLHCHGI